MKDKLLELKQKIEKNYEKLDKEYGDNDKLAKPIIEIIDLLLSENSCDEKIKLYLVNITRAIKLIEERIVKIENSNNY